MTIAQLKEQVKTNIYLYMPLKALQKALRAPIGGKCADGSDGGETEAICLEMANGEYIALFDHDDLLHPHALYEVARRIMSAVSIPRGRVTHAGVAVGIDGRRAVSYPYRGKREQSPDYMGRLTYAQDVSAVSGQCLLLRRFTDRWQARIAAGDPYYRMENAYY